MSELPPQSLLSCANPDCGATYPPSEYIYRCDQCGDLLEVSYHWDGLNPIKLKETFKQRRLSHALTDRSGVWRYRELLPFVNDLSSVVSLAEGNTPILDAPQCAKYAGITQLYLKHLGFNPTGSFKDYGMTAGITQAKSIGARCVACASTGNTSASLSAYAARAGIRCFVLVPAGGLALPKLSQALDHGAITIEVEGNFDESLRLLYQIARREGYYLLNSINPFRIEGQKAIIFEIMERFDWDPPDWIVFPGGNLGNCAAFGKALFELRKLGFISRLPRLAVIQAEAANPFHRIWKRKVRTRLQPVQPTSLATAINIGNPVSWKKALQALALTDGVCEQVKENEIANAKAVVGRDGIGCEPAAAASLAGIKKLVARGAIPRSDRIVGILTGHLLKDTDYTFVYHGDPEVLGVTGRSRPFQRAGVKPRFANRAIRVHADQATILNVLGKLNES